MKSLIKNLVDPKRIYIYDKDREIFIPMIAQTKWTSESIAAGKEFKVPPDKIYEVFAHVTFAPGVIYDLDSRVVAYNNTGWDTWFPCNADFELDSGDNLKKYFLCKAARGWILSEDEGLKGITRAIVVRWRELKY